MSSPCDGFERTSESGSEVFANTVWFVWAAVLSFVCTLVAGAVVILRESYVHGARLKSRQGSFLADRKRASSFYNVFSRVYDRVNKHFYSDRMRSQIACLTQLKPGQLVLDVGCGTGYTTKALVDNIRTGQVIAIDITPKQLSRATVNLQAERDKVSFIRAEADHLPFIDDTFDNVVSVGAIEYFPRPDISIKKMKKVVKQKGKVVVAGPERAWFRKIFFDRVFYAPSAEELNQLFILAGLKNVKPILSGLRTYFKTDNYVVIATGTK